MTRNLKQAGDVHPVPADCPDALVTYVETFDEHGIPVHDGGSPSVLIAYCPWCGAKLPESRRGAWFAAPGRSGFDESSMRNNPPEFKTDAWRRRDA
jgi:hypothetical protein